MIKIELTWAISLYLIISVIGLLMIWAFLERKKTPRRISPEEKFVWQCRICTFFYVDSQNDEISVCPRCGSYNSKEKKETDFNKRGEVKGYDNRDRDRRRGCVALP
jgi:hypothetical protein